MNPQVDSNRIPRTIVSVGQCGFDNSRIRALIRTIDASVKIRETDSVAETLELLAELGDQTALVLVNRVFDADGGSGQAFIRTLKSADSGLSLVPVMLVSNYEKSQAEAIADGALPGFGKSQIHTEQTRQQIEMILFQNS
ncbi:MAG: hypothetical protein NT172_14795 [Planctomycetota bacterium]|nr:hypothetical protein [Planctomycetota bacterium]